MDVKEAAERLNVKISTVRSYIKKGLLKAEKIPKGLKFRYEISEQAIKRIN